MTQDRAKPGKANLYHKLTRYCAYQERCTFDVLQKMDRLEVPKDEQPQFLKLLTDDGYLDNGRFARSYTRGKLNQNQWGFIKIRMALRSKGIAEPIIEESIQSIDREHYRSILMQIIDRSFDSSMSYDQRQKEMARLHRKGFELNLILEIIKEKGYDHIR
ncbi:MAG TPA: recombinase RecX [Flavobacteriales bacterium]|nr:recombinase RecX [Flavobacteriales bacterium]